MQNFTSAGLGAVRCRRLWRIQSCLHPLTRIPQKLFSPGTGSEEFPAGIPSAASSTVLAGVHFSFPWVGWTGLTWNWGWHCQGFPCQHQGHGAVSLPLTWAFPSSVFWGLPSWPGNASQDTAVMGKSWPGLTLHRVTSPKVTGGEKSPGSACLEKGRMEIGNFCLFLSFLICFITMAGGEELPLLQHGYRHGADTKMGIKGRHF